MKFKKILGMTPAEEERIGMTEGNASQKEYQETLGFLFGLQRFGIKLGLDNIRALLDKLGNPHRDLSAVHIAGTNGKGSTAAFLTSVLREAGLRVGLYTSPHLIDFSERIQVNGVPIPTRDVVRWTEHIREVVSKMNEKGELWPAGNPLPPDFDPSKATITFFEFTTAMAFSYFREQKVDVAVLEAGMGGRLDATNVIDPLFSLITTISLEHRQYLGKTLVEIAREKAGIIKPGRALFTSATQRQVIGVFREKCAEGRSPFFRWRKDFSAKETAPQTMDFEGRLREWRDLRLGLAGGHQIVNAALALAGLEMLMEQGFPVGEEPIRRGLAGVRWPGRLEIAGEHPRIALDGAHNPGATRALRKNLQAGFPRRRLILILGIMADKSISRMMADLVPLADELILTRPQMERAAKLETLRALSAPYGKPTREIPEVEKAVENAVRGAGDDDLILVSGSLFTVGEARAALIKAGKISG